MGKKVIICEKPSLAKNVCQALWKMGEKMQMNPQGANESQNYIVTSAFGHLYSLCNVEDYLGVEKADWKTTPLPFYPEEFRFTPKREPKTGKFDKGVSDRINLISRLVKRNDVDAISTAGTATGKARSLSGSYLKRLGIQNPFTGFGSRTRWTAPLSAGSII